MADGSGVTDVTDNHADSSLLRWSPDGSRLSVEIFEPGGSESAINVMNADGTGLHQLTQLRGWHAWSPDGSHLIVQRALMTGGGSLTGRSNLYVIDASGQEQRLVLENAAIGTSPAWRPQ
jgi:Tol biopolymer transport system component